MNTDFAIRLLKLRKEKDWTQEQLAQQLGVTDKTVSKWESGKGMPDILTLPILAEVFNTSLDFLLTGKDKNQIIIRSVEEDIAIEDSIEKLEKSFNKFDPQSVENLIRYVYKYQSKKVFSTLIKQKMKQLFLNDIEEYGKEDFLKMCFDIGEIDAISGQYNNNSVYIPLELIGKKDDQLIRSNEVKLHVSDNFFEFIIKSVKNEKTWDYILGASGNPWYLGLPYIFEQSVKHKDSRYKKLYNIISDINEKAIVAYNKSYNTYHKKYGMTLRNGKLYYESSRSHAGAIVPISESAIKLLISQNRLEDALKCGETNEKLNSIFKTNFYVPSEYEIRIQKVNTDPKKSDRDKLKESVIHEGLINIEQLVAMDDYDLYQEMIKFPASNIERIKAYCNDKNYKYLLEEAVTNKLQNTINALQKDNIDKLPEAIDKDYQKYKVDHRTINFRYYDKNSLKAINKPPHLNKDMIFFEDIINHKDIRFFEHAAKTDSKNIDKALEKIITTRSQDYELQKLLLDFGAKLHKRWEEDDGWGYTVSRDTIDEVATQLLKNQVEIMMNKKEV